jgi:hypothetical protein
VALRTAKKATKTHRVLGAPSLQKQKFRKLGELPPEIHFVEPQRLPANFCERRRLQYRKLEPQSGSGIPVPVGQLGTLNVARLSKSVFDVILYTQLLCRNVYNSREKKIAVQSFHELRRFLSSRKEVFGTSRFVRQSLKVISITLRLSKRRLSCQDSYSVAMTETPRIERGFSQYPLGPGLRLTLPLRETHLHYR